jgi:hypothetical protein
VVVVAEVMRDEAERGYVLRFPQMEQRTRAALEAMLCALPPLSDPTEEGNAGNLVLSQILSANS